MHQGAVPEGAGQQVVQEPERPRVRLRQLLQQLWRRQAAADPKQLAITQFFKKQKQLIYILVCNC
jgi:hypothetical protein